MQQISLHQVVPQVFAQREDLTSDVWKTEAMFGKGRTYLVDRHQCVLHPAVGGHTSAAHQYALSGNALVP